MYSRGWRPYRIRAISTPRTTNFAGQLNLVIKYILEGRIVHVQTVISASKATWELSCDTGSEGHQRGLPGLLE